MGKIVSAITQKTMIQSSKRLDVGGERREKKEAYTQVMM